MAVDQILFERIGDRPLLRFYEWSEPTVSLGYFEKLSDAKAAVGGGNLNYVRRWTGGGIVDHRHDHTYTLFIPKGHSIEQSRGNVSYQLIHQVLADSLYDVGVECELTESDFDSDSRACFEKPVMFDILGKLGEKLAGGGQKRARYGLLHQGSVVGVRDRVLWQKQFVERLTDCAKRKDIAAGELGDVSRVVAERYGSQEWLEKRV
jgi:lipoate-protein ligase A